MTREVAENNLDETRELKDCRINIVTVSQREISDRVMESVTENKRLASFIDARGGTEKTSTVKSILAAGRTLNNEKNIFLAVACSGIDVALLTLSRTFHSRFKAHLNTRKYMRLDIRFNGEVIKLIKLSNIIVWDEALICRNFHKKLCIVE